MDMPVFSSVGKIGRVYTRYRWTVLLYVACAVMQIRHSCTLYQRDAEFGSLGRDCVASRWVDARVTITRADSQLVVVTRVMIVRG